MDTDRGRGTAPYLVLTSTLPLHARADRSNFVPYSIQPMPFGIFRVGCFTGTEDSCDIWTREV
jgi:hypothetical protein